VSLLELSVTAGESGPIVVLVGEADVTSARALSLLGVDRMFTIEGRSQNGTRPDGGADLQS
jgi:hypothetical protein